MLLIHRIFGQSPVKSGDLESHFLKEEIEIVPGKTFFNLFIIQNKTSKNISFNLNFALPRNWVLIGDLNQKYTIGGNEKITIPVRVAVSKESMGGIGYVISAAISDESNSVFETKYCYLKIPAKPLLEINTLRENRYFSHKTKRTSFFLKIANKGNIDEYVNLKIEPDLTLDIKKSADEDFVENIHIKPNSDTITKFTFSLKSDEDFKHYSVHKAIITVKGRDTLIKRTVWFNHLDWKYENILPETEIPLIIELAAYNIFSKTNAIFIGRIYGTVLFNNNVDFFYSLENYSRDSETNSLWINSKISAGIRAKKINIFIGDYQGSLEQSMYGRGIYTDYSPTEKIKLKAVFTKGIERPVLNFGGEYEQKLKIPLTLRIGGAYTKGEDYIPDSKLLFGGAKLRVFKNNIRLLYGNSITTYNLTSGLKSYNGFGYELSYAGKINKFNIRMDNLYGSSLYSGYTKGRFIFNSSIGYSISNKSFLDFSYLNQRYKPVYFVGEDLFNDRFSNYELYKLQFRYKLSNTVELFGGPQIVNLSSNSFPSYDVESILASLTAKGEVGFMVSEKYTYNSLMFTARYTYTNIYKYSEILNETYYPTINSEPVSGFDMNLNLRRKNWGTYIIYKQGPQTIYNMYSYLYSSYVAKTFYIIPFYERYLFKKFVKLTVRGSYLNNISSKISRINVNPRLSWGFKGGWSFHFSGNISFQKLQDDSKNKFYTGTYFEFGIRKEFNFQQPRVKYYDFDAVFYKDLNGNRVHDINEPGVSNILTEIRKVDKTFENEKVSYGSSKELLSNTEGQISYINLAEGNYIINYIPQTDILGSYISETSTKEFKADRDTFLHIPFMEKNKVFGRVTLHRAKRSGLGDIPLDNIKIIVEGGEKTYSDLTDKNGYFELYIPVTDYYKVTINNIFYENFNIRQEYFLVKFNGYKQFEVSFDFDEKERKITGIDDSDFAIDDDGELKLEDVKVLRQTNLKGVVRDANSLKPIHANIIVTNSNTGELISETASSLKTGAYFTNFFSGKGYMLKVESKGYWTQSEMLEINQITTFENITRDIILSPITKGEVIELNNQRFASSSSEITPAAKLELENVIIRLIKNPTVKIEVQGHTDNVEALNSDAVKLSENRAKAVINYLSSRGVQPNRMRFKGMGDRRSVASNDSQSGRARNRRVELIVTDF